MEIQFSDWLHEIDHSVYIFNAKPYTICYKSFPDTLKLIIGDSGFRSSFELYSIDARINSTRNCPVYGPCISLLNEKFYDRNTNAFLLKIEATAGTELTGLICDAVPTNTGCSIGHDTNSPKNAYKIC